MESSVMILNEGIILYCEEEIFNRLRDKVGNLIKFIKGEDKFARFVQIYLRREIVLIQVETSMDDNEIHGIFIIIIKQGDVQILEFNLSTKFI